MELYKLSDDIYEDNGHVVIGHITSLEKCRDVTYYCVVIYVPSRARQLSFDTEEARDLVYNEIMAEIQKC